MKNGLIVYSTEESVEYEQSKQLAQFFTKEMDTVTWQAIGLEPAIQQLAAIEISTLYILPESRDHRKELLAYCKSNPKIILLSRARLNELLNQAAATMQKSTVSEQPSPAKSETPTTKKKPVKAYLFTILLLILLAAIFYFSNNLW